MCTLLLICLLLVAGCAREDAEVLLRRQVQASIAALAEHDHGAFMETVADEFVGPQGMDRQGVAKMARVYFLRYRQIHLITGPLELAMTGDRARVSFTAMLAGGQGGLLPDKAQAYRVDSVWRLVDADWQMIALEWHSSAR